ncbi:MAG TPA: STAS domain-containing protein [Actinomycetota bacterium]|nr:STAS domain-containing protein [Actinomycetota bacterium]
MRRMRSPRRQRARATGPEGDVIVDLSRLEFLDSSGIRAILAIGTSDRRVVLRRPAPRVRKVLDLTGIIGREGIPLADD